MGIALRWLCFVLMLMLMLGACASSESAPSEPTPRSEQERPTPQEQPTSSVQADEPPAAAMPPKPHTIAPPRPHPTEDGGSSTKASAKEPDGGLPFVGHWVSEDDGSILELGTTRFMHRFPYGGGTRENRGDVLDYDVVRGTVTLRYTEVLQDESPVEVDTAIKTLSYEIRDGRLYKWVGTGTSPGPVGEEPYARR